MPKIPSLSSLRIKNSPNLKGFIPGKGRRRFFKKGPRRFRKKEA